MLVTLVAMPWSAHARPSAALGALSAYIRANNPDWSVASRSEYLRVATAIGYPLYGRIAEDAYAFGESLYLALLYPEREPAIREQFIAKGAAHFESVVRADRLAETFDTVKSALLKNIDDVTRDLIASRSDVVGFTTCFGQLFANLVVAARVKEASPDTRIVLGGSTVSERVGMSLLEEYPFVDYVIQGEGERPFSELLRTCGAGEPVRSGPGILAREEGRPPRAPAELHEVDRLDDLPVPDFDEYAAQASELGVDWAIPIEGSRGCWWDRARRTGNPKSTCYFCNLNVQWKGYREKAIPRIVSELDTLSRRYETTQVYFLDNIIRNRGVKELGAAIASLHRDFDIFYEMRANVRPDEILAMWEAGISFVQFGIEALSSSVLAKIGKGTRTIQNLEVMKTCAELKIHNGANLITDFPGTTAADVAETVENIRRFAMPYQVPTTSRFNLGVNSTVDALREQFGIKNVRNADALRAGLPDGVYRRLKLFDLDFDVAEDVDWTPVEDAIAAWRERQRAAAAPLLTYFDGGTFIRINDRRQEWSVVILEGLQRDVYLFCMRIRSRREVGARFGKEALDTLDSLVEADLVFHEAGRYLSLATASHPRVAAARIRSESASATQGDAGTAESSSLEV
jgi:ribosomal peptide maturation radical SAM protein 1